MAAPEPSRPARDWEFSALAGTTSSRHDKVIPPRQPKQWTPFFLRRWTLVVFIIFFALLMIAFAVMFGVSNRDQGLATADPKWYYLWVYGPTATFTFIAAVWAPVEYRAKQMQPWVLMAGTFRPASDGLLLDYIEKLNFVALFGSLRRRHWLAFSGTAATFVIIFATVASSGLFVSSTRGIYRDDVALVAGDAFSVKKLPQAGSRPAINVYGALASNLGFPHGTRNQYAFQSFDSADGRFNLGV
jgi:hypothetical protein